ncbi:MAG: hypothetical protein Q8Q14_01905, partial [Gemmatimonadales bacterium]|nr:hypothetical protein [Gemmatimonadales bacterium]
IPLPVDAYAVDSKQAVLDVIANVRQWWHDLWSGLGISAKAGDIMPPLPGGSSGSGTSGPPMFVLAPGSVVIQGVNFTSDAQKQAVADSLWRAIARRMAQG